MKYFNPTAISIATVAFLFLVVTRIFNLAYLEHKVVSTTASSELSVVGEGKVEVVPDTATIDAGIVVNRVPTADAAKNQLSTVNNAIIASLKKLGIKESDIKTSNFNIYPEYSPEDSRLMTDPAGTTSVSGAEPAIFPPNGTTRNRIVGYNGSANVTVKIRNKAIVSDAIGAVTAAGANTVSGARFTVENPEKFREEARNKAIKNAKEQAQKLARSLGIRLGRVTNFVESGGALPYYGRSDMLMTADAKVSENPVIEEGTQTITSTVTLFFERK